MRGGDLTHAGKASRCLGDVYSVKLRPVPQLRRMSNRRLFALTLLLTTGVMLVWLYATRTPRAPAFRQVTDQVMVTSQLAPKHLRLMEEDIGTIVDFRPDGEAKDQPSSTEMELAARESGIRFHYIPVPHESIPASAVEELSGILAHDPKPILLYCRTGRRAARTFALAEASRADGPGTEEIYKMVEVAGFTAEDLRGEIEARISKRSTPDLIQ